MPRVEEKVQEETGLDLSILQGQKLDPALQKQIQEYIALDMEEKRERLKELKEKRGRDAATRAANKAVGVELGQAFARGQAQKKAQCGDHVKNGKAGGGVTGQKISTGQYALVCLRCQTVWFEPPDKSKGQEGLPQHLRAQIDWDTIGG